MSEPAVIPELTERPENCSGVAALEIHLVSSSAAPTAAARWWRIADFGVLGIWIAVVGFTLRYHEKWADEAQAWLIARDLDLKTIWFHELRYEGSPGLWHTILWIAQHVFHAPYDAIGYIGMVGATAGVALLIFGAPFPRYIRWPLAFTYFLVYQYAVIARPYTLLPLLAFAVAMLFKDLQHPGRMTVVLVLLANLSLHGTILAGCFGLVYLIDAIRAWPTLDARARRRWWICAAVMAAVFVFVVLVVKPTPDVEDFAFRRQIARMPAEVRAQLPSRWGKLGALVSGAFLDWLAPSLIFVAAAAAWLYMRRRLLAFATSGAALSALYLFHGYAHHHGSVFVALLAALWIAWPRPDESSAFQVNQRRALKGISILLLALCAVNLWDAAVVLHREYLFPYSGAEDAARYLKQAGATRGPVFGLTYGMVGVQAYFDRNILWNTPTSYFHHGTPFVGTRLDIDELRKVQPEYIVVCSKDPESEARNVIAQIGAEGYEMVHFSDGYYLYKRSVYERQAYFIFHRARTN